MNVLVVFLIAVAGIFFVWTFAAALVGILAWVAAGLAAAGMACIVIKKLS